MYIEKVETGSIITITGEYAPVIEKEREALGENWFFMYGETAPPVLDHNSAWELIEPIDFAS